MSSLYIPKIRAIDVVEILIIAVFIYVFISWVRKTRAYNLIRGILVILAFVFIAVILQMSTILWLIRRIGSILLIALVIIFQPELRRALEQLGQRNIFSSILPDTRYQSQLFSDDTLNEIVRAVTEMSGERIGALIVIEQKIGLSEYVDTGIDIDARVSSQLLSNIFQHNTPLHDGAVIIRGDRILAATCYLPLSESGSISKRFGTRHRAGVGITEVSDCFTIIVSEETGRISYARKSELTTGVSISALREELYRIQRREKDTAKRVNKIWEAKS